MTRVKQLPLDGDDYYELLEKINRLEKKVSQTTSNVPVSAALPPLPPTAGAVPWVNGQEHIIRVPKSTVDNKLSGAAWHLIRRHLDPTALLGPTVATPNDKNFWEFIGGGNLTFQEGPGFSGAFSANARTDLISITIPVAGLYEVIGSAVISSPSSSGAPAGQTDLIIRQGTGTELLVLGTAGRVDARTSVAGTGFATLAAGTVALAVYSWGNVAGTAYHPKLSIRPVRL